MFENFIWHLFEKTKFLFATAYFSCLDTRKVTKESQEILNSPTAQTVGFQKINTCLLFSMTYEVINLVGKINSILPTLDFMP